MSLPTPAAETRANCHICGFPTSPEDDFLGVDLTAAAHGAELAHWLPAHGACMDKTSAYYGIPLAEMTDPQRVLWWTAHLSGKSWTVHTDWQDIIATAGGYA